MGVKLRRGARPCAPASMVNYCLFARSCSCARPLFGEYLVRRLFARRARGMADPASDDARVAAAGARLHVHPEQDVIPLSLRKRAEVDTRNFGCIGRDKVGKVLGASGRHGAQGRGPKLAVVRHHRPNQQRQQDDADPDGEWRATPSRPCRRRSGFATRTGFAGRQRSLPVSRERCEARLLRSASMARW